MQALSLICLVYIFRHTTCDDSKTLVKAPAGPIKGMINEDWNSNVKQYLGIPYAKPPVGKLRFKTPEPIEPWRKTLEANRNGPACMQYTESPFMWYYSKTYRSEDCLYLNIFSPATAKKGSDLAVLFFIHGGGFTFGSNGQRIYDGAGFALRGNVIVVTINYRLGLFGFLTSDSGDAPGNVGMYDIILALYWVKYNIPFFGGDKKRITIHGQDAGALAVSLLCVSPVTEGLFSKAILESGSATFLKHDQKQANLNLSQRLAKAVKCASDNQTITDDPQKVLRCLRKHDGMHLAKALWSIIPNDYMTFLPQYGDFALPDNAVDAIRKGNFHSVPLLIGTVKDEGSFQITTRNPQTFGFFGEKNTTISKTKGKDMIRSYFKNFSDPEKYVNHYLGDVPDEDHDLIRQQVYTASGDNTILCHAVYFAEIYSKKGIDVFFYFFEHRPSKSKWAPWMGTTDFDEVPFVFGVPVKEPENYPQTEKSLSVKLLKIWAHFVNYGYPSKDFEWPTYSYENHNYVVIDENFKGDRFGSGPHLENCDLMRDHYGF